MPPPRTPRRAKGNENWAHIGQRGRKTGITLKAGLRDEHGLESIDGIFSSPEKSPAKKTGLDRESSSDGESMDIGQSTIREPNEFIGRNGRNLLPPRARSPMKTNIGSSPRRSMGHMSSPSRLLNGATPTRSISHLPNVNDSENRTGVATPSVEGSLKRGRKPNTRRVEKKQPPRTSKAKRKAIDLNDIDDTDEDERTLNGVNGDVDVTRSGLGDLDLNGDDDMNGDENVNGDVDEKRDVDVNQDIEENRDVDPQIEASGAAEDEDQEVQEPPSKRRKGGKRLLSQNNANAKMKPPPKPKLKPAAKPAVSNIKRAQDGDAKPRIKSAFAVRCETPAEDNGAVRMKSGRTSIKPLAFWRNERVVYGDASVQGNILTLPGMKEIIRTDEIVQPSNPKRYAKIGSKPSARKKEAKEEEEEDDDEREAWETETGIVRAQVMQWDPVVGKYDEENVEETEIAYAAEAIEMRDISGATFRFAKTLTLPFFGSGMVDLPPLGAKRVKNSRKMQMVFFVFYGRVTVDVGTPTSTFSIGRGGMWQVPRGNFYSINNHSETKPARIFFAQGCEVNVEVESPPA